MILSLSMLVAGLLIVGGVLQWRRGNGKQAALMAVLALIMIGNVIIWALPNERGVSLSDEAARQ